ncbi:hypothetical protein GJU40_08225 [Bacillus lacus]|uniref:Uncharacterized protein n=1 Tax=Metabacillus lacus TaxID=1983721 RepID=A0A7X2IYR6_9BACI|nr:hypothetical protein [Metabacillus lacus]MRX72145.1 hypothetical protein [Metabacillus lacus]
MKKKQTVLASLALITGLSLYGGSSASAELGTYSNSMDSADYSQYITNTRVQPISTVDYNLLGSVTSTGEEPAYLVNAKAGSTRYVYDSFTMSSTSPVTKSHYVSKVGFSNRTLSAVPLEYTQQNSETVDWRVSSNIAAEASLGNKFLADLKASTSVSVERQKNVASSNTVTFIIQIPVNKYGIITRWKDGQKGVGTARYKKYINGTYVGIRSERASGSGIKNADEYEGVVSSLYNKRVLTEFCKTNHPRLDLGWFLNFEIVQCVYFHIRMTMLIFDWYNFFLGCFRIDCCYTEHNI